MNCRSSQGIARPWAGSPDANRFGNQAPVLRSRLRDLLALTPGAAHLSEGNTQMKYTHESNTIELSRLQPVDRPATARRRRRPLRPVTCAAVLLLIAGCAGDEEQSRRPESVADLSQWIEAQSTLQFRTIQDSVGRCMAAAGFDYQAPAPPSAGELTGFAQIHNVSDQVRNPVQAKAATSTTSAPPPGYAEALGDDDGAGCAGQAMQQADDTSSLDAVFAALEKQPPVEQDPGYSKAVGEWTACMNTAGYSDLAEPSDLQAPVEAFATAQFVERGLATGEHDLYEMAGAAPAQARSQVADAVATYETSLDEANTKCSDESGITKLTDEFIAGALGGVPPEVFEVSTPTVPTTASA